MTERQNIRRLQMPEHGKERAPFDPERDIIAEDWRGMQERQNANRLSDDWVGFCSLAAHMRIIDPRVAQIRRARDAYNVAQTSRARIDRDDILTYEIPANMKIAGFPGNLIDHNHRLAIEYRLKEVGARARRGNSSVTSADDIAVLADIKILDPSRFSKINLDDIGWDGVQWQIDRRKDLAKVGARPEFASLLADIKVLDPERIRLNKEEWGWLHEELKELRAHGRWHMFAALAADMKILAAEEVNVTDVGLELVPQRDFKEPTNRPPNALEL